MKKIVLLLMATFVFAYITKAAEKLPYVSIRKAPAESQHISNLKLAIQGKKVPGATTNCDADDYKNVWGEALYQQVLTADPSEFTIGVSVGGEKNWGIDSATGAASATGKVLPAGVKTIWLGNTEIAKIGTNYCYNALTPYQANSVDPDEVAYVPTDVKTASSTKGTTPLGTGNNITLTVNGTGSSQNQDISWRAGKSIYDEGRMDYRLAVYDAMTLEQMQAKILIEMQNSKQCCGQSVQSAPVMAPAAMFLNSAPASPTAGNLNVTVKQKRDFLDWANTFFNGAQAVSAVKNAFWGIDINGNRRYYSNIGDFQNYYNGIFQGDNQFGSGSGGGGNGWGNTWPGTNFASTTGGGYTNQTIRRGF